ncbi:TIGR04255 family protein [Synechocystis sp. PCC 7509]|uniref:TIGR04255 family protein n=1 Tax=Synechocystis sp. PCC 7509 TaxID=927677 RepID=UPI0002AC26EE|nr:TIGR04255 family protein [Synechocystis sp. PCC 7509]
MRLANSPIVEAIFDIKVELSDEFQVNELLAFREKVGGKYPNNKPQMEFLGQLNFEVNLPLEIQSSSSHLGFIFISDDEKKIAQVKLDGFTFSQVKPYQNWKDFYEEAYKLWQFYVEIAAPKAVKRVALRYINRILIPSAEQINLKDYMRILPETPDTFSVTILDYFLRIVVANQEDSNVRAIINQTIPRDDQLDLEKDSIPLILDIDVFQENDLTMDDTEIRNIFENKLRKFRSKIFDESITDKTRSLFQ